jgi:hypothetical protein
MHYTKTIEELTEAEAAEYFDLYHKYCTKHGQTPNLRDFVLWYQEMYEAQA